MASKPYFRIEHMIGCCWQDDILVRGRRMLALELHRLANIKDIQLIRVDECDKKGNDLQ